MLALIAAIGIFIILKFILVPEDPLFIWLGSDKSIEGSVHFDTIVPWTQLYKRVFSPSELVKSEGKVQVALNEFFTNTRAFSSEQITPETTQPREVTVVIEPLGQANPKGRGSEVWVEAIVTDLEQVSYKNLNFRELPFNWRHDYKDGSVYVVFSGGERTPLTIKLKTSGAITLRSLMNSSSGQARITVDGISRIVDLYAPKSRKSQEGFLIPLPVEVIQRLKVSMPRTTNKLQFTLTNGPRLVHLKRAKWESRSIWMWEPGNGTIKLGPGVKILKKSSQGWLLQMMQSEGWIAFDKLQTKPFFLPVSGEFNVIIILWFVCLIAIEVYRPISGIGIYLRRQAYWAKYALPCMGIWIFYLLIFYPGVVGADPNTQWAQMMQFRIADRNPAFHTLYLWLITRIWLSPAAVALFQIFAMSSLVGWGLAKFSRLGVPSVILWFVCGLYALSPVTGLMTVSLDKDVLYSICVLWLTLLLLEIIVSKGKWLTTSKRNAILLGGVLLLVSLIRHNGPLISLGTVFILGVVYRSYWKYILVIFILCTGIYWGIRGPLYNTLDIQKDPFLFWHLVVANQIVATITPETPLTNKEEMFLNKIFPVEIWMEAYDCINMDSIGCLPGFDRDMLLDHKDTYRRIWIERILKNPVAFLKHELCSGSLVWRITPFTNFLTPETRIPINKSGLSTKSQIPILRDAIAYVLNDLAKKPQVIWLFWLPAFYLYAAILFTVLLYFRTRKPAWFLLLLPALLNSLSVLLVNPGQNFRYQYSVYLIGLMSFAWLFIPKRSAKPD